MFGLFLKQVFLSTRLITVPNTPILIIGSVGEEGEERGREGEGEREGKEGGRGGWKEGKRGRRGEREGKEGGRGGWKEGKGGERRHKIDMYMYSVYKEMKMQQNTLKKQKIKIYYK